MVDYTKKFETLRWTAETEWRKKTGKPIPYSIKYDSGLDMYLSDSTHDEREAAEMTAFYRVKRSVLLEAIPLEVPEGIEYSKAHQNFYCMHSRKGQGNLFYNIWKHRASEFPSGPTASLPPVPLYA